jgi:AcrR family transcriptional regulator
VASLLEAAGAEFAEKGCEATTMTAIATRARASIVSLYQFFPTKERVAITLIDQYVIELEAAFGQPSEKVPLLDVSVAAGRLARLFVKRGDARKERSASGNSIVPKKNGKSGIST